MNTQSIKISRWILFLLACATLVQVACKKENSGAPTIKNVRMVDSTKRDSTFTKALPGTLVTIQGANFNGLVHVYFNDEDAPFNASLQTNSNIIITIPADAPTEATNPHVSSTIKVVTDHGTATYNFVLVAPPPSITAISNENALGGQTITIWGANFYLLSAVIFPGNVSVTNPTVISPTQMTVVVPNNLTTAGPLQIAGKFGTGATLYPFNSATAPTVGFLANFEDGDPYFGWAYWGGIKTNDATAFPNNRGNYIELHNSSAMTAGDGAWYQDNRAVNVNGLPWIPASHMSDPIGNYAVKFEMSLKTTWSAGSLYVLKDYDFTRLAAYRGWKAPDGSVAPMKPNGWQTVTVPLTQFQTNNGSGTPASSLTQLLGGGGSGGINIFFMNDGTTTIPTFDGAFDNLRVVRIQ